MRIRTFATVSDCSGQCKLIKSLHKDVHLYEADRFVFFLFFFFLFFCFLVSLMVNVPVNSFDKHSVLFMGQ